MIKSIVLCFVLIWQSMIGLWPMAAYASPLSRLLCAQTRTSTILNQQNQMAAMRLTTLLRELGKEIPSDLPRNFPSESENNTDHCSDCVMGEQVDFTIVRAINQTGNLRFSSNIRPQIFRLHYEAQGPPVGQRAPPTFS